DDFGDSDVAADGAVLFPTEGGAGAGGGEGSGIGSITSDAGLDGGEEGSSAGVEDFLGGIGEGADGLAGGGIGEEVVGVSDVVVVGVLGAADGALFDAQGDGGGPDISEAAADGDDITDASFIPGLAGAGEEEEVIGEGVG